MVMGPEPTPDPDWRLGALLPWLVDPPPDGPPDWLTDGCAPVLPAPPPVLLPAPPLVLLPQAARVASATTVVDARITDFRMSSKSSPGVPSCGAYHRLDGICIFGQSRHSAVCARHRHAESGRVVTETFAGRFDGDAMEPDIGRFAGARNVCGLGRSSSDLRQRHCAHAEARKSPGTGVSRHALPEHCVA
jgi:hypothetical protein